MSRYKNPEEVAVELGLPTNTVKRLAKKHGTITRLERNRLAFSPQNIEDLITAIETPASLPEPEPENPFRTTARSRRAA
jgi:hypothetical protein